MTDEPDLFTHAELVAALSLVLPPGEAEREARRLKKEWPEADRLSPIQLSEDVLDLLSLTSEDCAERVRELLRLDPDAAAARCAGARERFGL